jgi:hypothetical protein
MNLRKLSFILILEFPFFCSVWFAYDSFLPISIPTFIRCGFGLINGQSAYLRCFLSPSDGLVKRKVIA